MLEGCKGVDTFLHHDEHKSACIADEDSLGMHGDRVDRLRVSTKLIIHPRNLKICARSFCVFFVDLRRLPRTVSIALFFFVRVSLRL